MINRCKGYTVNDNHWRLCYVCKRYANVATMPAGQSKIDAPHKVHNVCPCFWLHEKKFRHKYTIFKNKHQLEQYQYALRYDLVPKHCSNLQFLDSMNTEYVDYEEV